MIDENKWIRWNEPLCLDEGHVYNSVVTAKAIDVAKFYQHIHPDYANRTLEDALEDALDDFMIVHWAWFVDEEETPIVFS